jgi:hypothetical protein
MVLGLVPGISETRRVGAFRTAGCSAARRSRNCRCCAGRRFVERFLDDDNLGLE